VHEYEERFRNIIDAELKWLRQAAEINSVDLKWFNDQVKNYSCLINSHLPTQLTLHSII